MTQQAALIETLKQALKRRGLTYVVVARKLRMSEANVKRMFASKRFTLDRLEAVCRVAEMDLTDLVALYEESRQRIAQLTQEQEQELVRDTKLLLVAVCVRNRLSFDDIIANFQLTKTECIRFLAKLDKLKIIDLLPENRIKLRVSEDFRWLPNGPIERFFESHIQRQFLQSTFSAAHEKRLFLFGMLSEASRQIMLARLESVAAEFAELLRQDSRLPLQQKRNLGVMLAVRPWDLDLLQALRRTRDK